MLWGVPLAGQEPDRSPDPEGQGTLALHDMQARDLEPGEIHSWWLPLERGDFTVVEVRQRGIDVVVETVDPSGDTRREFDSPTGASGIERARWIADGSGRWALRIVPFGGTSGGTYEIVLRFRRPATERDQYVVVADSLSTLSDKYLAEGKPAEAERVLREAISGPVAASADTFLLAQAVDRLARVLANQGRFDDSEDQFRRALALREATLGSDHPDVMATVNMLGRVVQEQGRYDEARLLFEHVLTSRKRLLGSEHPDVAVSLNNLALLYKHQGRYEEAEPLYERALSVREEALGPDHPDVGTSVNNLASLYHTLGRYERAKALYGRALAIFKGAHGQKHPDVALVQNNLAMLYQDQGRYGEAEPLYQESLSFWQAMLGPRHPYVGRSLNNLATLYDVWGFYERAERLYERALRIREETYGPRHPEVAETLDNLAGLYESLGRFGEAEALYQRALSIREEALGRDHPDLAANLNNLATVYESQGRSQEATGLYDQALRIWEASLGAEHPLVSVALNNLARLYVTHGRYGEAEPFYRRALSIRETALGPDHPRVATSLNNLADLYVKQGRYGEAEPLFRRALSIREAVLGADHPEVAGSLYNLATVRLAEGDRTESLRLVSDAVRILDNSPGLPTVRIWAHELRARLRRSAGDTAEALLDLEEALSAAEGLRPQVGGGEETRAAFFAGYEQSYDLMVAWQIEAGDFDSAFQWAERGRSRTLLDQLAVGKVDLRASIPADVRSELEALELDAKSRVAEYQQRLTLLRGRQDLAEEERAPRIESLGDSLREADEAFRQVYRDIKNASPLWRDLLTSGGRPIDRGTAQRRLVPPRGYLLLYQLGEEESHLLVVPPAGEEPRALPLEVEAPEAEALGLEAGPLTEENLGTLLGDAPEEVAKPSARSLLPLPGVGIRSEERGLGVTTRSASSRAGSLAALWRVLVPKTVREELLDAAEVVVVPDGWLYRFPFEILVVDSGVNGGVSEPRYWLDAGPVIRYAPSATVLHNLERRPRVRLTSRTMGTLSVSDPVYVPEEVAKRDAELSESRIPDDTGEKQGTVGGRRSGVSISPAGGARSQYERTAGPLDRLPGTARETDAILEAFGADRSLGDIVVLQGREAREPAVRDAVAGKRYLHLATHGLVDEGRSHLFAALALTPPPGREAVPEDDGFLQLHEIYELPLDEAELTVLSACETNLGTRLVEGEGVFALSRGFLAAGARRVIASQWAVDDRSTAELMGRFFSSIASREQSGRRVDYAAALRDAKRAVRRDPGTADPFFWAPFVLIGKR